MDYCKNCGAKLGKSPKFCSKCGSEIVDTKRNESKFKGKPNITLKAVLGGLVILISFIIVFFLFIQPRYFSEAEQPEMSMELASGYWGLTEEMEMSDELTKALYIDEENIMVVNNGGASYDDYSIKDYSLDEEASALEIIAQDVRGEETVFTLYLTEEYAEDTEIMSIEIGNENFGEFISISKNEYITAGGATEKEVPPELKLSDITGYYVKRNETGEIQMIYKITEEYTSQVMLHPVKYSAEAYAASQIQEIEITDNIIELEILGVDHHSTRDKEYYDATTVLDFDRTEESIRFYLNGTNEPFIYTPLEDILNELDGKITFDLEALLTNIYEESLLEIIALNDTQI